MLSESMEEVEKKIQAACDRSRRKREEITLIAVSKTKPIEMLIEAYELGVREFGENKVQELSDKYEALPEDINWHMIGHLQRNKVKYIVDKVSLIHSVDSLRLAQTIEAEAEKKQCTVSVLMEVNVAGEDSKYGVMPEDVLPFAEKLACFPHLRLCGLMTIAPNVGDSEENRSVFRHLQNLSVDIMHKNIDNVNVNILSMGMTNDYEVAIEEGATMIRVGTGLFGNRNYNA